MTIEAIATGASVEEALEAAIKELGEVGEADVQYDIVDMPKPKVMGLFGGRPAKVRAYYEVDDKPSRKQRTERKADNYKKPAQTKSDDGSRGRKAREAVDNATAEQRRQTPSVESAADAVKYLTDILSRMNIGKFTVTPCPIEGGIRMDIDGENMGAIIGRRGETLDALQYLCSLANNSEKSGFSRIVLDTNGYRDKREQTLIGLATRMANQALRTRRNQSLEPMNPYERRIIHTAVQEIDGVTSWSVTDNRGRRVIIGLENKEEALPERPRYERGRRVGERGGDRRRSPRPKYVPEAPTREVMKDAGDTPLYGRIG